MALITLPAVCDGEAAEGLRGDLATALAGQPAALTIDAGAVGRVTTPCLQVLAAAWQQSESIGAPWVLRQPSETLVDALTLLGLERLVNDRDMDETSG
jgi:anti-anti-sigma regulatory factor